MSAYGEGEAVAQAGRESARVQWQPALDFTKPADPIGKVWGRCVAEAQARYGVPASAIVGRSRLARTTLARHHAWFLMRDTHGYSWPEIAAVVGRDHTSVMQSTKAYARKCGLVNWKV